MIPGIPYDTPPSMLRMIKARRNPLVWSGVLPPPKQREKRKEKMYIIHGNTFHNIGFPERKRDKEQLWEMN